MVDANILYTSIGDSLAAGKGATKRNGYTQYLYDFLFSRYTKIDYKNKGISGMTSSMLHIQLMVGFRTRRAVRNADILTISIGGNNLLGCANRNFEVINDRCVHSGLNILAADWPMILREIRQGIGSKAKIYVMNLYNPYAGDDPNYFKADQYIQQANAIFMHPEYRTRFDYKIADVYTHFQGILPDGEWKTYQWTHFYNKKRDPHPSDAGYREIARIYEQIL